MIEAKYSAKSTVFICDLSFRDYLKTLLDSCYLFALMASDKYDIRYNERHTLQMLCALKEF